MPTETESFLPTSRQQWRAWLQENHDQKKAVWLLYAKKTALVPGITYAEAVEEALCFGWIDSRSQPVDEQYYRQFFCPRKPGSGWSKVNKERIERLITAGLMAPAGLASLERARQNGSWTLLDDVEALRIPPDLGEALQKEPEAQAYFERLSHSDKRALLSWLLSAKREATRQRRIVELIALAGHRQKPGWLQRTRQTGPTS